MKCSECGCEIIDFPQSEGYCRECETFLINSFHEEIKSISREEKYDWLAKITAEMISRNMEV